jgi:hypothetical protein
MIEDGQTSRFNFHIEPITLANGHLELGLGCMTAEAGELVYLKNQAYLSLEDTKELIMALLGIVEAMQEPVDGSDL